jgi:1-deoxy-D-xylulose-5-phosphate synthase
MTWEALNNISHDNERNLILVVNDNGRSYAPTIGGIARFLSSVRSQQSYRAFKGGSEKFFGLFGPLGRATFRGIRGGMRGFMARFANNEQLYSNLDIKYLGPVDGHNLADVERTLRQAKKLSQPVIVHVITEKGRGYEPALNDEADQFHAVGQIDPVTGKSQSSSSQPGWTDVFSTAMVEQAAKRDNIIGVTAAMLRPTGLYEMSKKYPGRVLDVGIAEQHAVTSAAGLAYGGLHPVVAIYATFINRAFDQVLMDVALHKAGVTFVLDRAGVTGPDGASHHGMWDLSILQVVPGIRIAAPRDATRLVEELDEALDVTDAPTVVRFPRGSVSAELPAVRRTADGVDVLREAAHKDVLIVAVGPMAHMAMDVAARLADQGIGATVVDPRWVVPVAASVVEMSRDHRIVVSIEDGVRVGGIGTRIRQELRRAGVDTAVDEVGLPDEFLDHGNRGEILDAAGLTPQAIARNLVAQVLGMKVPKARPIPGDQESDIALERESSELGDKN